MPLVYFVRDGVDGPIKIGTTRGGVEKRIRSVQIGCARDLVLLGTIDGGRDLERELHQRFHTLRLRGEWFHPSHELLGWIQRAVNKPAPPPASIAYAPLPPPPMPAPSAQPSRTAAPMPKPRHPPLGPDTGGIMAVWRRAHAERLAQRRAVRT